MNSEKFHSMLYDNEKTILVPDSLYQLITNDTPVNRLKILEKILVDIEGNKKAQDLFLDFLFDLDQYQFDDSSLSNADAMALRTILDVSKADISGLNMFKAIITKLKSIWSKPQGAQIELGSVQSMRQAVTSLGRQNGHFLYNFSQIKKLQNTPGFFTSALETARKHPIMAALVILLTGDFIASKTWMQKTPILSKIWNTASDVGTGVLQTGSMLGRNLPLIIIGIAAFLLLRK